MAREFIHALPEHERDRQFDWLHRVHIDPLMLLLLLIVVGYGLLVLFSAVDQSETLLRAQLLRISLAFAALLVAAQLPPRIYVRWAPFIYLFGVLLLGALKLETLEFYAVRLEALLEAQLLTEDEVGSLENIVADGVVEVGRASLVGTQVLQMALLSEVIAADRAFARQLRRKFL